MTAPARPAGTGHTGGVELADRIADAVRAHPTVARLHGGPFGTVASYLAGRRVVGVRAGGPGEPVEIAVVLRPGHPVPDAAARLRAAVRRIAGEVRVDVVVADMADVTDLADLADVTDAAGNPAAARKAAARDAADTAGTTPA